MAARDHINWDQHYGKAFRLVTTPPGASTNSTSGSSIPDEAGRISVVTPANGNAWTDWPEAPTEVINNFKSNWGEIQKSLGDHKYGQIKEHM